MINWNDIDTILLDMDGTLLDLHYDNHFWMTHLPEHYASLKNISIDQSRQHLRNQIRSIEGTLDWYCLDYWSNNLGIDIPALKKETRHKIKERPFVQEFLSGLKHRGKQVYLVTNSHPAGVDIKLEVTNIKQYFDDIITSHQFGYPKEDLRFWSEFQLHTPFDKNRALFVDDNLNVLNAAAGFGIRHILGIHQPDSQTPRTLEQVRAIHHFDEILEGLRDE